MQNPNPELGFGSAIFVSKETSKLMLLRIHDLI